MDLTTIKVIALVLLGSVSLILGFLPVKLGRWIDISDYEGEKNFWKRTITSILLCFGGGVLLATSFVHMLPEVRESLESTSFDFDGIPVAEILFCCGFFLIYLIEELVHCVCDAKVHSDDEATISIHKTFAVHTDACEAGMTDMQLSDSQENIVQKSSTSPNGGGQKRRRTLSTPSSRPRQDYNTFNNELSPKRPSTSEEKADESNHRVTIDTSESSVSSNHPSGHNHLGHSPSSLRDFLTVLALSCHSIFEGLAIGLEKDSEAVWTLFAAVATHKFVIAFCVGLELMTAQTPIKIFSIYMTVFSLVSPLGIGIGIGISTGANDGGDAYTLAVAILQALAGGTLIYVVVFEVLQREKSKSVSGIAQLTFVILGFSVMMCIEIFAGHSHEDHHHVDETTSQMPITNSTIDN